MREKKIKRKNINNDYEIKKIFLGDFEKFWKGKRCLLLSEE